MVKPGPKATFPDSRCPVYYSSPCLLPSLSLSANVWRPHSWPGLERPRGNQPSAWQGNQPRFSALSPGQGVPLPSPFPTENTLCSLPHPLGLCLGHHSLPTSLFLLPWAPVASRQLPTGNLLLYSLLYLLSVLFNCVFLFLPSNLHTYSS